MGKKYWYLLDGENNMTFLRMHKLGGYLTLARLYMYIYIFFSLFREVKPRGQNTKCGFLEKAQKEKKKKKRKKKELKEYATSSDQIKKE